MQVVRAGAVDYYVRELVPGRAEGTGVAGESPGVWSGRGSAVLGVRGVVRPDDFAAVFAGRDPGGDRSLRTGRGPRAVAGVDLLFCAPKSVSLLHLLGPRELARATGAAHEAAVDDAVGYLERVGLGVRRTRGGVTRHLAATGAVAAGFVHRTSRALDPHVHTHLVTANVAQGVDGVWSAVDSRRLFLHRRPLEAVYDASLRRQLTDRLGVAWERTAAGRQDLVGVDPVLLRLFSQRTASIDESAFRGSGGTGSSARRRIAFHADRPAKAVGQTVEDLRSAWRRRAADHDLDPAELVRVVGRGRAGPACPTVDVDDLSVRLGAEPDGRTLGTRELVTHVADSSPCGMDATRIEAVVFELARRVPAADGSRRPADGGVPDGGVVGGGDGRRWAAADLARTLAARDGPLVAALGDPPASTAFRTARRERSVAAERTADRTPARTVDVPGGGHLFGPTELGHRR